MTSRRNASAVADQFATGLRTKAVSGPGLYIGSAGPVTFPLQPECIAALQNVGQAEAIAPHSSEPVIWQLDSQCLATSNAGRDPHDA